MTSTNKVVGSVGLSLEGEGVSSIEYLSIWPLRLCAHNVYQHSHNNIIIINVVY